METGKKSNVLKWVKDGIIFITLVAGGLGIYSEIIKSNEHAKVTQFDTPSQKHEVVKYVEDAPNPEQVQRKMILDSINTTNAINSRRKRDSLGRVRDSISLLNADQVFQIKEQQKLIIEEIRKIH